MTTVALVLDDASAAAAADTMAAQASAPADGTVAPADAGASAPMLPDRFAMVCAKSDDGSYYRCAFVAIPLPPPAPVAAPTPVASDGSASEG